MNNKLLSKAPYPLRTAVANGVIWMIAARWALKGLGFISTLFLVRLLLPDDFGLVAMASIVVGLTQILFSLGVDTALIQNTRADDSHFNTAWTIRLIQNIGVALIIMLFSPLVGVYFNEPRVVSVLRILSIGLIIQSFSNIGVVLFRKELHFHKEFLYLFLGKLISFLPTVALAFLLRNYWALVLGTIAGNMGSVILSYLMHPYRPRWSLVRFNEIWNFSQWLLVVNIGNYSFTKVDQFIVRTISGNASLGLYSIASEVAEMISSEITSPISRVVMPGYAKVKNDPVALNEAFLKVLGVMVMIATPVSVGLFCVADEVVNVVLGAKWLEAIPLLQWLTISFALRATCGAPGNLLVILGRVKQTAIITWIELLIFVGIAIVCSLEYGVKGVAFAKAVSAFLGMFIWFGPMLYFKVASLRQIVGQFYRPFFAAGCMAIGLAMFSFSFSAAEWPDVIGLVTKISANTMAWMDFVTFYEKAFSPAYPWPEVVVLSIKIIVGALLYVGSLIGMWLIKGRPQGAEAELLQILEGKFGNLQKRTNTLV